MNTSLKHLVYTTALLINLFAYGQMHPFFKGLCTFAKEAYNGHLIEIGTIFPCSKTTGAKLIDHIDRDVPMNNEKLHILEVGGGTGTMTDAFVEKLEEMRTKHNTTYQLDVVEILPKFCAILREKYKNNPHVTIIEKSITDWKPSYRYHHILSSVPFNAFKPNFVQQILNHYVQLVQNDGSVSYVEYRSVEAMKRALFILSSRSSELKERAQILEAFREKYQAKHVVTYANMPPLNLYQMNIKA